MNIFLNCTQHTLTAAQLAAAEKIGEIKELRLLDGSLFQKLSALMGDEDLEHLAIQLQRVIVELALEAGKDVYVHLPIGSPAFMFAFAGNCGSYSQIKHLFSHTKREVVETVKDGIPTKEMKFIFEKFILIE